MKVGEFKVNDIDEKEITGTVENWFVDSETFKGYTVLRGYMQGDVRNRWYEGTPVRTSPLVGDNFDSLKSGDVVRTLNSRYLLGEPRSDLGS